MVTGAPPKQTASRTTSPLVQSLPSQIHAPSSTFMPGAATGPRPLPASAAPTGRVSDNDDEVPGPCWHAALGRAPCGPGEAAKWGRPSLVHSLQPERPCSNPALGSASCRDGSIPALAAAPHVTPASASARNRELVDRASMLVRIPPRADTSGQVFGDVALDAGLPAEIAQDDASSPIADYLDPSRTFSRALNDPHDFVIARGPRRTESLLLAGFLD